MHDCLWKHHLVQLASRGVPSPHQPWATCSLSARRWSLVRFYSSLLCLENESERSSASCTCVETGPLRLCLFASGSDGFGQPCDPSSHALGGFTYDGSLASCRIALWLCATQLLHLSWLMGVHGHCFVQEIGYHGCQPIQAVRSYMDSTQSVRSHQLFVSWVLASDFCLILHAWHVRSECASAVPESWVNPRDSSHCPVLDW